MLRRNVFGTAFHLILRDSRKKTFNTYAISRLDPKTKEIFGIFA